MTYDKLNHWYGWNGGDCPVHPETEVEIGFSGDRTSFVGRAEEFNWDHGTYKDNDIIVFRIIKEHREPRELWVYRNINKSWNVHDREPTAKWDEIIHVREVMDE